MFKLTRFDKSLCALGRHYDFIEAACRDKEEDTYFSFLDFRRSYLKGYTSFYYWITFIICIYGMVHSVCNFMRVFISKEVNPPTMWHNHRFHVLPPAWTRRWNLVKAFVKTNAWGLLFYSVYFVSPPHMYPWLFVQVLGLISKLATATLKYIMGNLDGQRIRITVNLLSCVLTTFFVHRAMWAMAAARKQDTAEGQLMF